ncbi:MAG: hypothetical protein FJX76_13890 [Armatimonadetes bacterium]|nr:hypothetical protein [Armatimonadota bacterium]
MFVSALDDRHEDHFDFAGTPLWQKIIYIYYVPERREVRIRRTPITPPVPDPPWVDATVFLPAAGDHVIARNVVSLALRMEGWGGLLLPLRVAVASEVEGRRSSLETCAVRNRIRGTVDEMLIHLETFSDMIAYSKAGKPFPADLRELLNIPAIGDSPGERMFAGPPV